MDSAKRIVIEYSMIKMDDEGKYFSLHSLVQRVIKIQLVQNKDFKYLRKSINIITEFYKNYYKDDTFKSIYIKGELLLHLQEILKNLDECRNELNAEPDSTNLEIILTYLSNAYGSIGNAQKAKKFLERALPIKEKLYGKEHIEIAITLTNLGNFYGALDEPQKKKELLKRALTIAKKYYNEEHIEIAIILENLANAYGDLGNAQKKKGLLERVLSVKEKCYGKDHIKIAITNTNLGNAFGALGDTQKWKKLLKQALPVFENYYGEEHFRVALTLADLGFAYGVSGDVQKSKEFLERALPNLKKYYAEEDSRMLIVLKNLYNAYSALGDIQSCIELLQHNALLKVEIGDFQPKMSSLKQPCCYRSLDQIDYNSTSYSRANSFLGLLGMKDYDKSCVKEMMALIENAKSGDYFHMDGSVSNKVNSDVYFSPKDITDSQSKALAYLKRENISMQINAANNDRKNQNIKISQVNNLAEENKEQENIINCSAL